MIVCIGTGIAKCFVCELQGSRVSAAVVSRIDGECNIFSEPEAKLFEGDQTIQGTYDGITISMYTVSSSYYIQLSL